MKKLLWCLLFFVFAFISDIFSMEIGAKDKRQWRVENKSLKIKNAKLRKIFLNRSQKDVFRHSEALEEKNKIVQKSGITTRIDSGDCVVGGIKFDQEGDLAVQGIKKLLIYPFNQTTGIEKIVQSETADVAFNNSNEVLYSLRGKKGFNIWNIETKTVRLVSDTFNESAFWIQPHKNCATIMVTDGESQIKEFDTNGKFIKNVWKTKDNELICDFTVHQQSGNLIVRTWKDTKNPDNPQFYVYKLNQQGQQIKSFETAMSFFPCCVNQNQDIAIQENMTSFDIIQPDGTWIQVTQDQFNEPMFMESIDVDALSQNFAVLTSAADTHQKSGIFYLFDQKGNLIEGIVDPNIDYSSAVNLDLKYNPKNKSINVYHDGDLTAY